MAFRTNSYQQLSFTDSFGGLTSREQKALASQMMKLLKTLCSIPVINTRFIQQALTNSQ